MREPPFEAYRGEQPYAFVCYAHADADQVFPEIMQLRQMGVRIWYDEGIEATKEWLEAIGEALQGASFFIVFVSPRTVTSHNCRKEINRALTLRKRFLAIHLEETKLTPGLSLGMEDVQAILKYKLARRAYESKVYSACAAVRGPELAQPPSAIAVERDELARRELADLDAQTAEAREASEQAMAAARKAREALMAARKELADHEQLARESLRRLEGAEQRRRQEIEERLEFEARTRSLRLAAEDHLRQAKERLSVAQKFQAEILERIHRERDEAQARVKAAGDVMAAALASQRLSTDRSIEDRRRAQAELDEAQLRQSKERLASAQRVQAEILERISREREEAQARVKAAGDAMAAALASQRQSSDRSIKDRRRAQADLDEASRALEESERAARETFERLRRAQNESGGSASDIPDSM